MVVPLSIILQKAFKPVLIILSALIAYQIALLTWSLLPQKEPQSQWIAPLVTSATVDNKVSTVQLQGLHLFGKVAIAEEKIKPTEEVRDAPKTKLNLTLVGVVSASNPLYSSAIIVYQNAQDSYFIDSIIEGTKAKISKIHQDRVLLDVDGELQTLMLDGVEMLEQKQQEHGAVVSAPSAKISSNRSKSEVKTISIDREALLKILGK
ncbi:type II secretion system protein N [Psychromonas sp. MME1]|uniref:type II secretion system protein N n=1 Tax=Psychromonas sp. MME1 TaxID=3231032 RepID=UPI0034E1A01A